SERRSLTLTLQRPARRRVSLPAGKEQAAASSLLLSLPESVTLYASRSLASLGLRRHDRVCAADGSSACAVRSAAELRQALERGEACDISIVRPGSEEAYSVPSLHDELDAMKRINNLAASTATKKKKWKIESDDEEVPRE
ncbi:unnamed protein product, partial [Effrenium voratum]